MKEKLTKEKVAETILARYESEGYHELTEEERELGRKRSEHIHRRRFMNNEILIDNNSFSEIESKELQNIDGGIGVLAATWVVVKVLGVAAGAGFIGGAVYETVFGD